MQAVGFLKRTSSREKGRHSENMHKSLTTSPLDGGSFGNRLSLRQRLVIAFFQEILKLCTLLVLHYAVPLLLPMCFLQESTEQNQLLFSKRGESLFQPPPIWTLLSTIELLPHAPYTDAQTLEGHESRGPSQASHTLSPRAVDNAL